MLHLVEATLNDWEDQLFSSGGNNPVMPQVGAGGGALGPCAVTAACCDHSPTRTCKPLQVFCHAPAGSGS
jgi:hypothetical protein